MNKGEVLKRLLSKPCKSEGDKAEIDEALLAHPDVAQAVAFAVPHPTLGEDVAAAVGAGQ